MNAPRFDLGGVITNLGVMGFAEVNDLPDRHARGDWGDVSPEQRAENEAAMEHGGTQLVSAYRIDGIGTVTITTLGEPRLTFVEVPEENPWSDEPTEGGEAN